MTEQCELCEIYARDVWDYWKVGRCNTCNVPMAVLNRHDTVITREELAELLVIFETCYMGHKLRTQARKILDHVHFHFVQGRSASDV